MDGKYINKRIHRLGKRSNTQIIIFLFILANLFHCNIAENKYILSNDLGFLQNTNNKLYYDLYKTGIDNYRFEILLCDSDTVNLINIYLNDAHYSRVNLNIKRNDSTIIISTNARTSTNKEVVHYKNFRFIVQHY